MLKNNLSTYGFVAKILHWTMALLFILMFIVAFVMINIPKSDFRMTLYFLHKSTGLLLFALFVLRVIWRFLNVQPLLSSPKWQKYAAHSNIFILYALMLLMPITGFLTSTLGGHDISFYSLFVIAPLDHNEQASQFFSNWHEILAYFMIGIFSLHVLASLYHHTILKDNVLKRMWLKS